MKKILSALFLIGLATSSFSQNCGNITDFRATIVDNGNGTSTYNFEIDVQSTSGGSKSVNVTISCPNHTFVSNSCHESNATLTTYPFGPFTVTSCTGGIMLDWTGHSNSVCGGTTCATVSQPLPVELSAFDTKVEHGQILLNWTTEQEVNNEGFEVLKSIDGKNWEKIGWVEGAGTTQTRNSYQFVDTNPTLGQSYYRLKQVDFNGQFEHSNVRGIRFLNELSEIQVFPNPVRDMVEIRGADLEFIHVKVMDNLGRVLMEGKLENPSLNLAFLPNGIYYLAIQTGSQTYINRIFKE